MSEDYQGLHRAHQDGCKAPLQPRKQLSRKPYMIWLGERLIVRNGL